MATTAPAPFSGTLKLATYPNRFNAVVPVEGPFYRTGFQLTSTGSNPRPLTEGLDYYLCYYFKEAAEALKDQVFGGIMLLTETECNYTILSVGREYRVPQSEIGKYLVSPDLKDPRNVDWSELMRYAPVVAPIDPPTSLEEAILRDDVVAALDAIRLGILARAKDLDAAYSEVTELIFQTGKQIFDDNLYQHHLIKNAHEYTAAEVGALTVLTKAVDATKAFGKTIDELVDIMKTNGISQTHIDTLMPVVLGELRGRLKVLDNGALTFRTSDSSHVITLQGDKFLITTTKPITITADADKNEPGIGVEVTSGLNAMYALSGAKAPIFNGAYLITPDMVSLYLTAVKLLPANAYFQSTDSLKIFGSAKDYSPVSMTGVVPTATTAVPGLILITSVSANISAGAAISQAAVNTLKSTLDNYVDATYKVNGKSFVADNGDMKLTLVKGDIQLGNVENTSPNQKPVTTAIANILKNKSLSTHTHVFGDLTGVPTATDTVAGLVQLWDAIDATTNKVVTSKQGFNVQNRINTLKDTVNLLLPSWTTGGSAFGNPGYLPIPAVGNYAGFTKQLGRMGMGTIKQERDVVYVLRNSNDGIPGTDRIYYAYARINNLGALVSRQQSSLPYHPVGMSKFPGVVLEAIAAPGEDAIVCRGSDGQYYTVMLDGTLDHSKHTRIYRSTFPTGMQVDDVVVNYVPQPDKQTAVVYKGLPHLIHLELTNVKYHTYMLKASITSDTTMVYTPMALSGGTSVAGVAVRLRENVNITDTNPATLGASYVTPEGLAKWSSLRNISHNWPLHSVALRNNQLRLGALNTLLLMNNDESHGRPYWTTSFIVDLDTGVVTLDNPDHFPIKIDADGAYLATGELIMTNGQKEKIPYGRADNRGRGFPGEAGRIWSFYDQSTDVSAHGIAHASISGDWFDYIEGHVKSGFTLLSDWQFVGGIGSVYTVSQSHPVYLGNNAYLFSAVNNNSAIYVEVDPNTTYGPDYIGAGPTNNRRNINIADYYKLADMTWCAKGSLQSGKLNGAYWTGPATKNYQAVGDMPTADVLTISQAEWNKIVAAVKSAASAGDPYDGLNAGQTVFSVWAIRPMDPNPIWLVQASFFWLNGTTKRFGNYVFQIYPTVTAGQVQLVTTTADQLFGSTGTVNNLVAISNTNIVGHSQRMGQPIFYEKGDGTGILHLPNFVLRHVVGSSSTYHVEMIFSLQNGKLTATRGGFNGSVYYRAPSILSLVNDTLVRALDYIVSPAYFAGKAATPEVFIASNATNYVPTGPTAIIAGVKTAEGWNFYITEDIAWRIGPTYYTAAAYNVDLKTAFPGNYQNRVFHVHVVLNGNTPEYQLLASKLADTDTRLYLGTITTDSTRIVGNDLKKVKRLGGLKQMVEHAGTEYRHDVDRRTDQLLSPLGLLHKEPLASTGARSYYLDAKYSNSVISPQKRSERQPTIIKAPKVFAPGEIGDVAPDFFPQPLAVLAQSGENSAAATAGMLWVGALLPDLGGSFNWQALPQVTPTESKLRIKLYIPASIAGATTNVGINGQNSPVPHGEALTVDIDAVPGTKMVVRIVGSVTIQNWRVWGSKWFAYGIYDYDPVGGTETQLAVSGVSTPLIYNSVSHLLPNVVTRAEVIDLGVNTNAYWPVVSAGNCTCSPPVIVNENSTTIKVATIWISMNGLETATDIAVNLMPRL